MSPAKTARTGRRPGPSSTREAIADAAGSLFSELGYDRTTIRAIAAKAGVDPALVVHFFGSKQQLFLSVMSLPFEPEEVIPRVLAGPRSEAGRRFAQFAVEVMDDPQARRVLTGILRAAASEPEAARLARELAAGRIVGAISAALDVEDAGVRASLVASQIIGVIMARHVIGVEPLASLPAEKVVEALAPNLQRYLTGPLNA
jgi:AcrR family transcriptional regulator